MGLRDKATGCTIIVVTGDTYGVSESIEHVAKQFSGNVNYPVKLTRYSGLTVHIHPQHLVSISETWAKEPTHQLPDYD